MTFNIINRIKSHPWALLFFLWMLVFFTPAFHVLYFGELIYINGEDEYSYLNYEFAKENLSIKRLSNILIIFFHDLGLNGSKINLILDNLFFISAATLIALIINKIAIKTTSEKVIAIAIFLIAPLFLTQSNPLYRILARLISNSELLTYYIVFNHSIFPSYLRTPEGQISILLLLVILYIIVSRINLLLAFLLFSALYFFTGFYALFVGLLYFSFRYVLGKKRKIYIETLILSIGVYFIISIIIGFLAFFTLEDSHILKSRAPLFSLNFLFMFLGYFYLRKLYYWDSLNDNSKYLIYSILISSFFIYNTNLINGILLQPRHYEMDGGLFFGLMIIIFYLFASPKSSFFNTHSRFIILTITLIGCLFVYKTAEINIKNQQKFNNLQKIMKNNNYFEGYRPSQVYINDVNLSSIYNGLFVNKSSFYLSSIEPAFLSNKDYYNNLLILRKIILNENSIDPKDWLESLDYLLSFYNSDSLNWDKFTLLRRGYYFTSDISSNFSSFDDRYVLIDLKSGKVIPINYKKH